MQFPKHCQSQCNNVYLYHVEKYISKYGQSWLMPQPRDFSNCITLSGVDTIKSRISGNDCCWGSQVRSVTLSKILIINIRWV